MIDIERKLLANGNLIAESRRLGRSLSGPDRRIMLRVRAAAREAGYAQESINALEMEGERGRKGYAAKPVEAVFRGIQNFGRMSIRLYDIRGDHPQNHSTVSVMTLVHEGILPTDLKAHQIACEYLKEAWFMVTSVLISWYYEMKGKWA